MSYRAELNIGIRRAWQSPGPFAAGEQKLGDLRRAVAALVKAANIGLTPLCPSGFKLELFQRRLVVPAVITPERLEVARSFFAAFSNPVAQRFVREILMEDYTQAILAHHPQREYLERGDIRRKCRTLVGVIFRRLKDISARPEFLFDVIKSMSRSTTPQELIWFPEYQEAYEQYKHAHKLEKRDRILFPHIVGDSLVDIGCGGGDQVADLKARHPKQLVRVAGIDVKDWRTPGLDIDYYVRDFSKPGTVSPRQYDTGMLLAVLHHVGNTDKAMGTFLGGVKTAVTKRLIVEEDVLITPYDLARTDVPGLEAIGQLRRTQPELERYLRFDVDTQRAGAVLMDLLGNSLSVGVPDMAFPFGFRTLSEWIDVFTANGFILNRVQVLGFQEGNFNRQCHMLFILDLPE